MSVAATSAPAQGWYPDPQNDSHLRWWDGHGWTAHTIERPQEQAEPAPEGREETVAARDDAPGWVLDLVDEVGREVDGDEEPIEFSWDDTFEADALDVPEFRVEVREIPAVAPLTYAAGARPAEPEPGPELDLAALYDASAYVGPRHAPAAGPDFAALAAVHGAVAHVGPRRAPEPVAEPAPEPVRLPACDASALVGPQRAPQLEPEPAPTAPVSFVFRARPLAAAPEPVAPEVVSVPVYESPLAAIKSPLPAPLPVPEQPTLELAPPPSVAPAPESEPEQPTAESPALPAPPAVRRAVPRIAIAGGAGVVVAAAAAAGITNLISSDPEAGKAAGAAAISTADKLCLKEWNTTASGSAAQLRVTLGQFTGAHARVQRVQPLPGTLMGADSCALTVYDPATDTNAVFVSGVQDQIGYIDVTSYPRAGKQYGWPRSEKEANVAIGEDGTISAL